VRLLNRQLASLRRRLDDLTGLLEASEALNEAKDAQIVDLGRRLNAALATKVQELARYRSEFFGRLREILGDNQNIRIVGDRFVFQAEVLFPSGSATLEPEGREQIAQLAGLLRDVAAKIPPDIDWVLRVDGHTDVRPISTFLFPSNWELSAARAVEVVKVLIDEGIPPNRLAAAGFGEYQPIEAGTSEEAFRRNRRIEFKLTER
jgi:chemotaxis protein MotB